MQAELVFHEGTKIMRGWQKTELPRDKAKVWKGLINIIFYKPHFAETVAERCNTKCFYIFGDILPTSLRRVSLVGAGRLHTVWFQSDTLILPPFQSQQQVPHAILSEIYPIRPTYIGSIGYTRILSITFFKFSETYLFRHTYGQQRLRGTSKQ